MDWSKFGLELSPDSNYVMWKFVLKATNDRGQRIIESLIPDLEGSWPWHETIAEVEAGIIFYIRKGPLFLIRLLHLVGKIRQRAFLVK